MATRPDSRVTQAVTVEIAKDAIQAAKDLFEDEGVLEIDLPDVDKEILESVSAADNWQTVGGGMYVKAWVWVQML